MSQVSIRPLAGLLAASYLSVGCTDAMGPGRAPIVMMTASVASLPVANASVQVIPGLDKALPQDINNSDWVVGYKYSLGGDADSAFRWDPQHGVQWLSNFGSLNGAIAVNDVGNTLGWIGAHVVVWLANGNPDIFERPSDSASNFPPDCSPVGMNKYSVIIGNCNYRDIATIATMYPWHKLPSFRGDLTVLAAISDDGWIAGGPGEDINEVGIPAFVLSPNNELSALTFHTNRNFAQGPIGITVHGWAAGQDLYGGTVGCPEAVAWLAAPHVFRPEFRLGTCGAATGLTPDWYIVGTGTDSAGGNPFAFVWYPGKGLQRLPGLGGASETSSAVKINLSHHVVGWINSDGKQHTVIWSVAPRPGSTGATVDSIALIAAVSAMK
jgi:hypothetical protein